LSPFLCGGVIAEYFNLVGKTPDFIDVSMMQNKGELMKSALAFSVYRDLIIST
jgi:hypothetical protein